MGDWDPMLSDYQDLQFNSYTQGVGRDLANGKGRGTNLYVDNFPVEFGQEGFINLFSDVGRVVHASLKASNRENGKLTYGFVTMDSAVAAERAISEWNGRTLKSGAQLIVKPALSDEQKRRRAEKKQMENDFMASLGRTKFNREDDMMSSVSGFAPQDLLYEQRMLTARAKAILEQTGHANDLDLYLGGGPRFRPEMDRIPSNFYGRGRGAANAFADTRVPRNDYGGRGRGFDAPNDRFRQGPRPSYSAPSIGRGSLPQFDQPRRPKAENLRICINCGIEDSAYRCQACKSYYCSHECQRKDWARHKDICLDISIHNVNKRYEQNGTDRQNFMQLNDRGFESDAGGDAFRKKNGVFEHRDEEICIERLKHKGDDYKKERFNHKDKQFKNERFAHKDDGYGNERCKHRNEDQTNEKSKHKGEEHYNFKGRRKDEENNAERFKRKGAEKKGEKQRDNSPATKPQTEQREFESKKRPPLKFNKNDPPNQDKRAPEMKNKPPVSPAIGNNAKDSQMEKRRSPKAESTKDSLQETRGACHAKGDLFGEYGPEDASKDLLSQNMEVGTTSEGYLTHYDNPSKFWITLGEDVSSFLAIAASFKKLLLEMPKGEVKRVKAGDLYCTIDEDFWARVKVVTVGLNGDLTVFFPDIGKEKDIHVSELFPLDDSMRIFPSQAMCCCIGNAKPKGRTWDARAKKAVGEWLGEPYNHEVSFEVLNKRGNTHALKISRKGENLADFLVSQGHAEVSDANANLPRLTDKRPESAPEERLMARDLKGQADCLETGDQVSINITEFQSLTLIMGHIISPSSTKALSVMEGIIKGLDLNNGQPYSPIKGEFVMAKYSQDNIWYRSQVVKTKEDKFQVLFLDYGNVDTVTSKDIRRVADKRLATFPALAAQLQLWGVDMSTDSEDVLVRKFADLLGDFSLEEGKWTIVVKGKKDSSLLVDFVSWAKDETLSKLLNKKMSPKKVLTNSTDNASLNVKKDSSPVNSLSCDGLPNGVNSQVIVNFVNSCSSFYVMHQDKFPTLASLMSEIQGNVKSLPACKNPKVGDTVIALFNTDKSYYRAQIKSISKNQNECRVFYLDYGNCGEVSLDDILQIPQWASSEPALAIHCSLDVDSVTLCPDADENFKCMGEKIVTVSVLRKESNSDKYIITMMGDDGSDLLLVMTMPAVVEVKSPSKQAPINSQKAETSIEQELLPISDEPIPVIVSHFESVCDFYVYSSRFQELYGDITELQQTANEEPLITNIGVGTQCFAKFKEDGVWYRSQVTSSIDGSETCTVRFIDHGNSQETLKKELRELSESAKALPAMAISCCFKDFEECLSQRLDLATIHADIDVDRMKAGLTESQMVVTVHSHKSGASIVTVTDSDGNDMLNKYKVQKSVHPTKEETTIPLTSPLDATLEEIPVVKMTETSFEVLPTNMESLTEFYCQGKERYLHNALVISTTLGSDLIDSGPCKCKPMKGNVYACLFENDWYRCVVEEVADETVRIRYIDWGNKEYREASDLRSLQPNHLTFPITLMRCQLHGVEILEREQEYIKMLKDKLLTNSLWIDIVDQQGDKYNVSLSVAGENKKINIVEDLIELGIAKSIEEDAEDDEDEEEVERRLRELQKQMEELKLKKGKKK